MGDLIIAASNKEISVWKPSIKKKQMDLSSMNILPQTTTMFKNRKNKRKRDCLSKTHKTPF